VTVPPAPALDPAPSSRGAVAWRVARAVAEILVVQGTVCAAALLPITLAWHLLPWPVSPVARAVVVSAVLVPSYVAFALCLMGASALATAVCRLRTPADAEMRIDGLSAPLLRWVHYMVATHLVRMLAGPLFRGTPVWTGYLRLNGARFGRRVYINSLSLSDYNLLEFGDDVVIGGDVHLSGHTVEGGVVKTARVRLGHDVTIGLGSVIDIGVEIGAHTQIGALSLVPKHTRVPGNAVYVGIPIKPAIRH
jgi:acetyltransferase-like isoleucine patch superfamily enzyme